MPSWITKILIVVVMFVFFNTPPVYCVIRLDLLRLPPGFAAQVVIREIINARQIALTADQSFLFAGSGGARNLYAVSLARDPLYPDDIIGTKLFILASSLNLPNGVAYDDATDTLYFSQLRGIYRMHNVVKELKKPFPVLPLAYKIVYSHFPTDVWHGAKYIRFRNDRLYVPQGAPCNACAPDLPYASLSSFNTTAGDFKIHARGIRNTLGFDWHPNTGELWFTDNGRDGWGNSPGDELNVIRNSDGAIPHFGFPYCYGKRCVDPTFNNASNCDAYIAAEYELDPHVAALGMAFYRTDSEHIPQEYRTQDLVLIAEHGSWDSAEPKGYRITMVNTSDRSTSSYRTFIDGWLSGHDRDSAYAWGRPVDVLMMKDGSFLISDDKANAIYRIVYNSTVQPFRVSNPFLSAFLPIAAVLVLSAMTAAVLGTILWSRRKEESTE